MRDLLAAHFIPKLGEVVDRSRVEPADEPMAKVDGLVVVENWMVHFQVDGHEDPLGHLRVAQARDLVLRCTLLAFQDLWRHGILLRT